MMSLTRRYRFCASHRLHTDRLSEDENRQVYGKCNNAFGHGHDYILEVTVRGPLDEATGRVASVGRLDRLVQEHVLKAFDCKNLNEEVEEFSRLVPTSENLAEVVLGRLAENWQNAADSAWPALERVRLQETGRNSFEAYAKEGHYS